MGGLYLLYNSNRCCKYKLGLIRTLVIRILLIYSTDTHKNGELILMKQTLKKNACSQHLIRRGIRESEIIIERMLNKRSIRKRNLSSQKKTYFSYSHTMEWNQLSLHKELSVLFINIHFTFV